MKISAPFRKWTRIQPLKMAACDPAPKGKKHFDWISMRTCAQNYTSCWELPACVVTHVVYCNVYMCTNALLNIMTCMCVYVCLLYYNISSLVYTNLSFCTLSDVLPISFSSLSYKLYFPKLMLPYSFKLFTVLVCVFYHYFHCLTNSTTTWFV